MGKLPFSVETFLGVFGDYNTTIWPSQVLLYVLAFIALFFLFVKHKRDDLAINLILSVLWIWMAVVYHWIFFSTINKAAYVFGAFFLVQGLLFLFSGVVKDKIHFSFEGSLSNFLGLTLIIYALIVYPILNYAFGHVYPTMPTFGLPCPTTIFTFGLLLMTDRQLPKYVVIIPFLWSLVGFSAAVSLHVVEDFGLVVAGVISAVFISFRKYPAKI